MAKKKTVKRAPKQPEYDSDDSRAHGGGSSPDEDDVLNDEIDNFHNAKEKVALSDESEEDELASDKDEVMGIKSDEEDEDEEFDEDEMASDLDEKKDNDLAESSAWGKKKSIYYDADELESDEDLEMEEKEAAEIQKRMIAALDETDFGIDALMAPAAKETTAVREKVDKDISQLSKEEKLELIKKQSPEFLELRTDFRRKMEELSTRLWPIFKLIREGKLPKSEATEFIRTNVELYLNYCVNLSFYFMLKAKQISVKNHPIIKRIVQFRNLIEQLAPLSRKLQNEIELVLNKIEKKDYDFENVATVDGSKQQQGEKRVGGLVFDGDYGSSDSEDDYSHVKTWDAGQQGESKDAEEMEDDEEIEESKEIGKRAITYEIEKNRGLTPKRKKENRNPRVKHRNRYRKAKIQRKSTVREPRKELKRYGGELSGIRAGVKRSVKLK